MRDNIQGGVVGVHCNAPDGEVAVVCLHGGVDIVHSLGVNVLGFRHLCSWMVGNPLPKLPQG